MGSKLIIVTALTCSACKTFKNNTLNKLLDKLRIYFSDEDIIKLEFPTIGIDNYILAKNGVDKNISKYIGFFPTILLVPNFPNTSDTQVYGAEKNQSTGKYVPKNPKMDIESIFKCVNSNKKLITRSERKDIGKIPTLKARQKYTTAEWDPWADPNNMEEGF